MTLAEKAYQYIRRDIVRGGLAPGQPLRMAPMSERYQMGFSPLREALTRLQSERLVVSVALRGFSVAPLSMNEMWDAINTRIHIETEALRLAILFHFANVFTLDEKIVVGVIWSGENSAGGLGRGRKSSEAFADAEQCQADSETAGGGSHKGSPLGIEYAQTEMSLQRGCFCCQCGR